MYDFFIGHAADAVPSVGTSPDAGTHSEHWSAIEVLPTAHHHHDISSFLLQIPNTGRQSHARLAEVEVSVQQSDKTAAVAQNEVQWIKDQADEARLLTQRAKIVTIVSAVVASVVCTVELAAMWFYRSSTERTGRQAEDEKEIVTYRILQQQREEEH
eukprot:GEMP01101780.1.p1 GENE.GEMP01101780.1~~GEMP01101780.1.p1  ORF type:complete len:157 (+),score=46.64 GEMP01101780.1:115-585(+)